YPLGLGPDNADFMQQLDARLPDSHRHMHNNFLNVAVENGWLGLLTFLWWMGAVIFSAFSTWRRAKERDVFTAQASLAIGVALVGWQVAGVAEYNFGDGEVRIIAMFLMGLVLALAVRAEDLKRYASA
ncbi:MAG: hypothetical protein KDD44_09065, partial [Bdellovibrionales bacterium]|nr:hypothetical protein [Bdellovibrionales bacterium]